MSLLDCLLPRTVEVPDLRTYKNPESKRRANRAYYWRNRDRLLAKERERYWRRKAA